MVGPVIFDAIKRYLRYKAYEVNWVVNITDVDDKLIEAAAKLNTTVSELAEKYTKEYLDCLSRFGIESVDRFPKASEHMPEIIEMCQKLIDGGFAYAVDGNVWFDVAKDNDYGKLSNRKVEEQESGTRTLEGQRQTESSRLRPLESRQAGRAGMGFALGQGPARAGISNARP